MSAAGSYSATAPVSGAWIMQIAAFKTSGGTGDTTPPTVAITAPTQGSTVSGTASVSASATDDVGVAGVQFLLDGANLGTEDTTSPYSVSWDTTTAVNGSHTLAARARDAAGNSATSTSVTVTVDNQAPSGTVSINSGAAATNTRAVTLTLSAVDTQGAVTQMRFSNNGTTFNAPVAYAATAPWTLTTGSGTKTVYAQFKAVAGNWSTSATDTIVLDTTAPTITNRTATSITANSATITWTTSEPADSQVDYGLTTSYGSSTPLDSNRVTSHSVAISGLNASTLYHYRVRSRDGAGNLRVSSDSTFTTGSVADATPPTVAITAPAEGSTVSGTVIATASATDDVVVAGVQFLLDGANLGAEDTTSPYSVSWDTAPVSNGSHALTARARDAAGNTALSTPVTVNVANTNFFQNEVLATGFNLPTAIKFLPDGRLLVVELPGTIKILPPPYTTPDPTPFLQLNLNIPGYAGLQQGIFDIALDPNFATNHYYYIFYTKDTPNRDRLSRFTANATSTEPFPEAKSSSIRIRKIRTRNTMAARSISATTARSTSRPASTSTRAMRGRSRIRAARSIAST